MKKLVFVCSGNTCRSPLAEGIAKKIFPERLLKAIRISSAGTSALEGLPASNLAIEVAGMNNIDLTGHRTRLLKRSIIKEADLIVPMTKVHMETIGSLEPEGLAYAYLLGSFSREEVGDIEDPVGQGIEAYKSVFATIQKCVEELRERLEDFDGWKR